MEGNNFTWADLNLFYFCTEDFLETEIVQTYPIISNLVSRVGQIQITLKYCFAVEACVRQFRYFYLKD